MAQVTGTRPSRVARWGLGLSIASAILWVLPFFGLALAAVALVLDLIASSAKRPKQPKKVWVTGLCLATVGLLLALAMTAAQLTAPMPTAAENESGDRPVAVTDPSAETDEGAAPEDASVLEPVREHWQRDGYMLTPQFVGMTLADAKELAEDLKLRVYDEDAGEDERMVWIASNWVVVAQDDPPGTFVKEGDQVFLSILKRDEVTTEIADGQRNELLHTNERLFTGVVTGYRNEEDDKLSTIYVDDRAIELDLITPVAPLCADPSSIAPAEALAALRETLKVGQRVLVVVSDPDEQGAFVHLLSDDSNTPAVERPADSANERLIRSGWWVPYRAFAGGPGLYGDMNAPSSYESYQYSESSNSTYGSYGPLLATAAEETAVHYVAGAGDCRRAAEAEAEEWRQRAIETADYVERFRIEQERRRNEGVHCRDGDGDGLCNEG